MLQDQEFIQEFVEEASVHVENIEAGLLKIDNGSPDSGLLNDIFRAVHSIKGSAGFFDFKKIVELAHSMENVLGELRSGKLTINRDMVDLLLKSNDCLKSMVNDVGNSDNTDISEFATKLSDVIKGEYKTSIEVHNVKESVDNSIHESPAEEKANERMLISDGVKYGHKLYKIQINLENDLGKKDITPIQFVKKIESIGSIIDSSTNFDNINGLDGCLEADSYLTFIFMTVLEKKLIPIALGIPEDSIIELNAIEGRKDLSKLLNEEPITKSMPENDQKVISESEHEVVSDKNKSLMVEDSIRVHVTLLNSILNLASELVLGRNQLLRAMEKERKTIPGIDSILQNVDRITTELQEKVMQTRMQPISNVFNKFPRIIRDLSKKLNKEIVLNLEGTEVELDKSIIESLADPLTHLVRNAVDHGLELPEKRVQVGKPKTGTVTLRAYHEGGYVNIDIMDDGAGIDVEKIKQKALEKDLISKGDLSLIGEQEALQILFKPGFSTAEKVTDVSGRGVGMDVVKTNIEKLGGTVEIFTEKGVGTTFRLLLPLTLAIIPSLIVEVENQKFALPQVNLQEIVRIKPGDSSRRIEYIHNSEVLRLRGKLLPIVHLSDVLGLQRTYVDPETYERKQEKRKSLYDQRRKSQMVVPEYQAGDIQNRRNNLTNVIRILVLKIGSRSFGIAVDLIHGSEEILVKPIPKYIKDCKCCSGVTIMGDGKAALILDPEGIISKSNLKFMDDVEKNETDTIAADHMMEQQNLLIFKCSGTETFGIDLSMVSRVEEINGSDIEMIGDKEYIKFRGESLRLIRPEDYLPVTSQKVQWDKLFVIVPKLVKYPMGILIEKIHDTMQTGIKLNQEDIKSKGIIGSTILNNRIVLLINIYELFEKADPEHYITESKSFDGGKKTILIAEDTPFFLRLEKNYLEAAGYDVLTARNGKEALQILQEKEVHGVVSDIQMPIMDGLELIKKIREDKNLSKIPVIAVTSMTGEFQRKAGIDAGFDYYESKLDRVSLLEKVELALKKRRDVI